MEILLSNHGGILRLSKKAFNYLGIRFQNGGLLYSSTIVPNIHNEIWEGKDSISIEEINKLQRIVRTHPKLIQCYKDLGEGMNYYGDWSDFRIVDLDKKYGDSWYLTYGEMGYEEVCLEVTNY